MKLLLTGASGFLGRNLLLQAPEQWQIVALYHTDQKFQAFVSSLPRSNVTAVRCDLAAPPEVAAFVDQYGDWWDCCLYLAAKVDIPWSVRDPKADLFVNAGCLLNLLERIQAERFVYFSSGAVYDGLTGEVHPDAVFTPTLPYAISKLASEQYVQFFHQRRRSLRNYLIVRFFGAYGPYEAPHKIYTRLIRTLVIEGRSHYKIYGDGQNLIDAMYVEDAVDAVRRIMEGNYWNGIVNLAAGRPVPIETLVRETAAILGVDNLTVEKEGIAHESNHFWGSTTEMYEHYGFRASTPLSTGIMKLRDFLLRHECSR